MSKKTEKNRSTSAADTRRGYKLKLKTLSRRGEIGRQNLHPNPTGRPDKRHCFTDAFRAELLKRKKFRHSDGSLLEASELELIALKVIRELRTAPEINHRLLGILLDRIEGKPKESVELDATVKMAGEIDPRDVLIKRLNKILGVADQASEEDVEDSEE